MPAKAQRSKPRSNSASSASSASSSSSSSSSSASSSSSSSSRSSGASDEGDQSDDEKEQASARPGIGATLSRGKEKAVDIVKQATKAAASAADDGEEAGEIRDQCMLCELWIADLV